MDLAGLILLVVAITMSVTQAIKKLFKLSEETDTTLIALLVGVVIGGGSWALGFFNEIAPGISVQYVILYIASSIVGAGVGYDKLIKPLINKITK